MAMDIQAICRTSPVVPVVVIDRVEDAVPLARALVKGGLKVIEVTLRTPVALDAIRAMRAAVPEAIVGAGTILSAKDLDASMEAGAQFGVSPGTSPSLVEALVASGLPFLPGAATPSEVLALRERGFRTLKFFPAEPAGGIPMLKSIYGPIPDISFCPTGGIDGRNAADYLALPNIACVGGSWVAPASALKAGDFDKIAALAADASQLRN